MSDVIIDVGSNKTSRINLGIQGENIVEHVIFNIASWIEEYGEGVAYVYARRSGDLEPYPVALDMDMDAKTATWDVNLVDTAVKGRGSAQLVYVVDEDNEPDFSEDEVKKTKVFATTVQASLVVSSEENPEGYSTWLEVLGGYTVRVESAKAAAQAAQTAAETAQGLAEDAQEAAESARDAAQSSQAGASASATNAAASASAAATSETNAANSATSASSSASAASASATNASNSASAAAASAATAGTAATNASQSATAAAGSATSAGQSASAASSSASSAANALTEVQTARTTALSDINSAKTTAVGAVQQAQTAGVAAVEEASSDIISDMANPYDSTKTYKVGEYCLYQNQLYVCTTAITTAEAWTAGHWEAVNVGDELTDLKGDLNYDKTATPGYILTATNSDHGTNWSPVGLPSDEQTAQAVTDWLDAHPEATTTVQDGSITESKLASTFLNSRFKYKYVNGETIIPSNGDFIYENCTIGSIATETSLTGTHIFVNCNIGVLFVAGGEYEFHNCSFDCIRVFGNVSTAKFYSCNGHSIILNGNVNDSVIDGCTLTAVEYGCIVINGGVADNVKIKNNTLINNQSATLTGVDLECINTHGVSNSVIENNYCIVDTDRYAIDISGHGDYIRSFNNVIRNNIVVGGQIVLFATKDVVCMGNYCTRINIYGQYLTDDYGVQIIQNNVVGNFDFRVNNGNPTISIYISDNVCNSTNSLKVSYEIPENVNIYFFNNTIYGVASQANSYSPKVHFPENVIYIPANSKDFLPQCYIVKTDIPSLTEGSYYNGGVVENDTVSDRYVVYRKYNIFNGQSRFWSQ